MSQATAKRASQPVSAKSTPPLVTQKSASDLLIEEDVYQVDGELLSIQGIPFSKLPKIITKPRESILSPWLKLPYLVMICGGEGVGKSTFIIHLLKAISEGRDFGPWKTRKPRKCIYIDGESPHDFMRIVKEMGGIGDKNFSYYNLSVTEEQISKLSQQLTIPPEYLLKKTGNLSTQEWREDFFSCIRTQKFAVAVFDSLATLCPGLDFKSDKDWGPIGGDIMHRLVAQGTTVILLHHVTKKNDQYGTRLMKIPMNVILYLREIGKIGVHFTIEVDKYKENPKEKLALMHHDIKLEKLDSGPVSFTFKPLVAKLFEGNTKKDKITKCLQDGMTVDQVIKTSGFARSQVYNIAKDLKLRNGEGEDGE